LHQDLTESGLEYAIDYGFCGHFHDEIQAAVKPEYVNLMMETSIKAIEKSGKYFNLLCPFTGESRTGANWKETH
jgi:hypothetical protein